jgi:hypothetical protein
LKKLRLFALQNAWLDLNSDRAASPLDKDLLSWAYELSYRAGEFLLLNGQCRGLADGHGNASKNTRSLASALTPNLYLDAGASQAIQLCSIRVVRVENRGPHPKHDLRIHNERPIFCIGVVERDTFAITGLASPADLPKASNAGLTSQIG